MKKILLILMILLSTISISQIDYPRYESDSLGNKIIVMTIEQAQSLDNKAELLQLFEKLNSQIGEYDSICIQIINEKDMIIIKQDLQIKNLKDLSDNKNLQIKNLQSQILDYKNKEELYNKIITNKEDEIKIHKKEIKRLKTKMIISGSTGGLAIIGLIILLIK